MTPLPTPDAAGPVDVELVAFEHGYALGWQESSAAAAAALGAPTIWASYRPPSVLSLAELTTLRAFTDDPCRRLNCDGCSQCVRSAAVRRQCGDYPGQPSRVDGAA